MRHFAGGGCLLGENHNGLCLWPQVVPKPNEGSGRVLAWRKKNSEKYRAYMRDYMRRRRSK